MPYRRNPQRVAPLIGIGACAQPAPTPTKLALAQKRPTPTKLALAQKRPTPTKLALAQKRPTQIGHKPYHGKRCIKGKYGGVGKGVMFGNSM